MKLTSKILNYLLLLREFRLVFLFIKFYLQFKLSSSENSKIFFIMICWLGTNSGKRILLNNNYCYIKHLPSTHFIIIKMELFVFSSNNNNINRTKMTHFHNNSYLDNRAKLMHQAFSAT